MFNKIKNLRITSKTKLILSLVAIIAILSFSTISGIKKSSQIAKALDVSPTQTPTSTPVVSKTTEPTSTPEPKKNEIAKSPTPEKKQTQAPAKNYTRQGNSTTQPSTTKPNTVTNSGPANPPATPAPQPTASGILGYINQVRAENGLVKLSYSSQLNSAAKAKSQDMLDNNYFSHTSPDGRSDFDFIRAAGYSFSFAGSNIAKGNFTEKSVFEAWMNSAGHRANILDARAREFGYGVSGNYFTMMVGAK